MRREKPEGSGESFRESPDAYFYNYCRRPLIYLNPATLTLSFSLFSSSSLLSVSSAAHLLPFLAEGGSGIVASASTIANKLITRCRRTFTQRHVRTVTLVSPRHRQKETNRTQWRNGHGSHSRYTRSPRGLFGRNEFPRDVVST